MILRESVLPVTFPPFLATNKERLFGVFLYPALYITKVYPKVVSEPGEREGL